MTDGKKHAAHNHGQAGGVRRNGHNPHHHGRSSDGQGTVVLHHVLQALIKRKGETPEWNDGCSVLPTGCCALRSFTEYQNKISTQWHGYNRTLGTAFGPYVNASQTYEVNFGNGYFGTTAVTSAEADGNGEGQFEYAPPTGYFALCTNNLGSES